MIRLALALRPVLLGPMLARPVLTRRMLTRLMLLGAAPLASACQVSYRGQREDKPARQVARPVPHSPRR
jgi:hypothetical protein